MSEEGWASEPEAVEEVVAQKAEKKSEEQAKAHEVAAARKEAKMLEQVCRLGNMIEIEGIPMEVIKVDGMTVTLKRKDIVG